MTAGREKFTSGQTVQHRDGGPVMTVMKYLLESDLKGIATPSLSAKRTEYVKVMWLEKLQTQYGIFHQEDLLEV